MCLERTLTKRKYHHIPHRILKRMDEKEFITEINQLIMENNRLKATIRQQRAVIDQLRANLAAAGVETVTEAQTALYRQPKKGRPPAIDDQTRERVRELKKKGLPVRQIAKMEGISTGTVSNIINNY